jgi:hypothetical protein
LFGGIGKHHAMARGKRTTYVVSSAVRKRTYRLAEELLIEFPQYDLTQEAPEPLWEWEFVADLSALQSQLVGGMYWRRGETYLPARAEVTSEIERMHSLASEFDRSATAIKLSQIHALLRSADKNHL